MAFMAILPELAAGGEAAGGAAAAGEGSAMGAGRLAKFSTTMARFGARRGAAQHASNMGQQRNPAPAPNPNMMESFANVMQPGQFG